MMLKALEILNIYYTHGEDIMFVPFKKSYVEEAIAELEALVGRCCDTCKWEEIDSDEPPCNECSVGYSCYWEAKQ